MSRMQLATHLKALAADVEFGGPRPGERIVVSIDDWTPARRAVPCLVGRPTGHPILPDRDPIWTSELFFLDVNRGLARTFSRWYRLGEQVEPEYWRDVYREREL
jgi:hypothetical protein